MKVASQMWLVDLLDADVPAGEDVTEADFLAVEAGAAAPDEGDGLIVEG